MKLTFVDPSISTVSFGLRQVSSYLKANGHKTKLVFLPVHDFYETRESKFSDQVLDDVVGLCKDADAVGFSLMSNFFLQGRQITKRLKEELDVPIIWGGAHPTIRPDECIQEADVVCVGEGEEAMLEYCNRFDAGQEQWDAQNLWFKKGGEVIRNGVRPLEENLDKYPFQDYDIGDHYVENEGRVVRLDEKIFKDIVLAPRGLRDYDGSVIYAYYTCFSRGCPHACTYCCNNAYLKLYSGKGRYVRRRSVENCMAELKAVKEKFPFLGYVRIIDDTFLAAPTKEITDFASRMKAEIDLPFSCITSPVTITEEKMQALVDAGLRWIEMGIQSGSNRTNRDVYKRHITREQVLAAARILNKHKAVIRPRYDIIMDNPYETEEDLLETAKLLADLPRPYRISSFSLTFFPGTELYARAKADCIVKNDIEDIYKRCYLKNAHLDNLSFGELLVLNAPFMPGRLVKLLARKRLAGMLNGRAGRLVMNKLYATARTVYKKFSKIDYWKG